MTDTTGLACRCGRFSCQRTATLLGQERSEVNDERMKRLWRRERRPGTGIYGSLPSRLPKPTGWTVVWGGGGVFALIPVIKEQLYVVEKDQFGTFLTLVLVLLDVATIAGFLPLGMCSSSIPSVYCATSSIAQPARICV